MKIETPVDRASNRKRQAVLMIQRQELEQQKKDEAILVGDFFLRMVEVNHAEAVERDAQEARKAEAARKAAEAAQIAIPAASMVKEPEEKPDTRTSFMNGFSVGAVIVALIFWAFLTASGMI